MFEWIKNLFVKQNKNSEYQDLEFPTESLSKAEKIATSICEQPEKWRWSTESAYTITTRTKSSQSQFDNLEIWIGSDKENHKHISIYKPQNEKFCEKDQKIIYEAIKEWASVTRKTTFGDKVPPMFGNKVNDKLVDNLLKE